MSFSTLGASEFTARLFSALAGAALALTPLLFYDSLGRTRTFVWSALLALLTVPVAASRTADGTSFMLLFTMLEIYMIRRYWYSQRLSDALWAIACLSFMLLLSSPSGLALLLVLVAAGWLAVWRTALSAPQRLELPRRRHPAAGAEAPKRISAGASGLRADSGGGHHSDFFHAQSWRLAHGRATRQRGA